jgi:hypothetical protein
MNKSPGFSKKSGFSIIMKIDLIKPFFISNENKDEIDQQVQKQTRRFGGLGAPQYRVKHNKKCPICGSYCLWHIHSGCRYDPKTHSYLYGGITVICPNCQKCTVDEPLIPDNDAPPIQVTPYMPEWVKCPHCGVRFKYTQEAYYRKGRHCRCGQQLIIRKSVIH